MEKEAEQIESTEQIEPTEQTEPVEAADKDAVGQSAAPKLTGKQNLLQIVKFVLFSAGAGTIQTIAFTLLNELVFIGNYWPSYIIALALSVVFNFTINRRFTFKSTANVPKAMLLALLFYVPFAPYTTWLTDYLTIGKGWNEYLVLFINLVQNLILEFLWWRFVIYRKSMNNRPAEKEKDKDKPEKSDGE
ncbi:MAG: GtrA family protein [Clostridiales bacterium]|jgi:putative flippase GtrA|nr:GtrA family protein [Clostridiales bacterium]